MNSFVVILLSLGTAAAMHLGYTKGQRYTYNYQGEVYHAIPGGSAKTLGLRVKCHAHLDVFKKTEMQITLTNIQVHQVTGNRKDPKQQQEVAADERVLKAMQQKLSLAVKVIFKAQDGSIKEINAHPQDEEWSLNIKRGLVNLLQVSPQVKKMETNGKQYVTQYEYTGVGECQVSYVIHEYQSQQQAKEQVSKATKVINYEKCRQRPDFSQNTFYGQYCDDCQQSMGYAPYHRSVGQIDYTLYGSLLGGYIINRCEAFEQHVFTPFSRSGGQVTASARQILQYLKQDAVGPESTELTKKISQIFFPENPDKYARQNAQLQQKISQQVEKCVDELCKAAKDPVNQLAAQKFSAVVHHLRKCNKVTLEKQVEKMLTRQDETERRYCLDALSYVGTSEAFQVLKQIIQQKKISKQEEVQRVFLGLGFAPKPTADHIETAWELCKQYEASQDVTNHRHCLLSFGALVYKINQRPEQDTQAVTACQQHVKEMLDKLADPQTSPPYMLTYIKTLGNAGSTEAREQLLKIIKDQKHPLYIRVNCVWALRRIAPLAREKTYPYLVTIFADAKEYPELRMAVFLLMLNSEPNFATLHALVNTVRREITNPIPGPRSNQLASFVLSHLSALAYYDNVLMKKRSMQARMALRLMPRMSFGLGYSKGMRWAHYSEKFQAGVELEANKFDVPESMLPRNMNARLQFNLFGYKMNAFEFGTRVQNMDDVIEQLISQVRRRHKRSLWESALSWFGEEIKEEEESLGQVPTKHSTRPATSYRRRSRATGHSSRPFTSRPTSHPTGPSTRPRPTYASADGGETQQRRVSAYMKLFGDEVKFAEMKNENVDQLANDVADLLLGKKDKIEYPGYGILITKDKVVFQQHLEKAILVANARRMLPTLAGLPLDMQLRSSAALNVIAAAEMTVAPSLMSFWQFQKITGSVDVKPSVHAHANTRIGIHTPYLHVGLQMNHDVSANPYQKAAVEFEAGKKYELTYNIPQERRNFAHIKAYTQGFVEQYYPDTYERKERRICMELNTPHLKQVQKTCAGKDLLGVQFCTEGKFPDLASLRLQQIPVLPTIGQTEVYVYMEPAADKPTCINFTNTIEKNDIKEVEIIGEISASSKTVTRRIPYGATYQKADQNEQLEFETKVIEVQGWEDYKMKVYANRERVKVDFGKGGTQYQVTVSGQIKDQGKCLRLQADWTELPEQLKKHFYDWQPQIWFFLQQFAWIRRTEQLTKQIVFELQLTSPLTANLKLKTPDAEVERTDMSLPVTINCFPQSIQEIKNYFFAKCDVQDQSIRVFDQLQYQHNIRGGCPYVLVQENRKGKQSRIQLSVKIDDKGRKTVMASIQQQTEQSSKETVQVNPDATILIDGQKQECRQKACQSKQGGATVRKVQTSDGKTQIKLSTKLGLYATIEGQRIRVYASPLLHGHVHGLCGDCNGEEWNEYKDPHGQLQNLQKFIQSWQQKC